MKRDNKTIVGVPAKGSSYQKIREGLLLHCTVGAKVIQRNKKDGNVTSIKRTDLREPLKRTQDPPIRGLVPQPMRP